MAVIYLHILKDKSTSLRLLCVFDSCSHTLCENEVHLRSLYRSVLAVNISLRTCLFSWISTLKIQKTNYNSLMISLAEVSLYCSLFKNTQTNDQQSTLFSTQLCMAMVRFISIQLFISFTRKFLFTLEYIQVVAQQTFTLIYKK